MLPRHQLKNDPSLNAILVQKISVLDREIERLHKFIKEIKHTSKEENVINICYKAQERSY